MASRDDMVMAPRLRDVASPSAPTRARAERAEQKIHGKRGVARLVARLQARRLALGKVRARRGKRHAAARGSAGFSGSRFINPAGLAVVGALAGAVTLRLATGRSFGNIGANMSKALLGGLDIEARASLSAKHHISSDRELAWVMGREGRVNDQIKSVYDDLKKLRAADAVGQAALEQDKHFQSDDKFGVLIDRAADMLREKFRDSAPLGGLIEQLRTYFANRLIGKWLGGN